MTPSIAFVGRRLLPFAALVSVVVCVLLAVDFGDAPPAPPPPPPVPTVPGVKPPVLRPISRNSSAFGSTAQSNAIPPSASAPYTVLVHKLLLQELGLELATALYDPLFFDTAVAFVDEGDLRSSPAVLKEDGFSPDYKGQYIDAKSLFLMEKNLIGSPWRDSWAAVPAPMATMATRLIMLKQTTSLAFARIARDGRLSDGWATKDVYGAPVPSSDAYIRPIRAAVKGVTSYAITFLQLLIHGEDRMPDLKEWASKRNGAYGKRPSGEEEDPEAPVDPTPPIHPHLDPIINILQLIRVGPSVGEADYTSDNDGVVNQLLAQSRRVRDAVEPAMRRASVDISAGVSGVGSSMVVDQKVLASHAALLKASSSKVFGAILHHYARATSTAATPSVLLDCIGYATLAWRHRLKVLDLIADSLKPSGVANGNRGQYALQYYRNHPYTNVGFERYIGRFWASMRPVIGCSSLMKQCDEADGCRYLCNFDFILGAAPKVHPSHSSAGKRLRYAHQAVGIGSNNEYDWELSTLDSFARAGPGDDAKSLSAGGYALPNTIGRVTTFDCTLGHRGGFRPPAAITQGLIGFGHVSYCLGLSDARPDDETLAGGTVGFPALRRMINSDGRYPDVYPRNSKGGGSRRSRPENPLVKRYAAPANIALDPEFGVIHRDAGLDLWSDDVVIPSPLYVDFATFDEVSILKIDMEGFEHPSYPSFLRTELTDLHQHFRVRRVTDRPTTSLVTFDTDASDSATVGQLLMEIHRGLDNLIPSRNGDAFGFSGALVLQYNLMLLYAKGFQMYAQEKNPVSACCYEFAMVHSRFFVRSEVWHGQRLSVD